MPRRQLTFPNLGTLFNPFQCLKLNAPVLVLFNCFFKKNSNRRLYSPHLHRDSPSEVSCEGGYTECRGEVKTLSTTISGEEQIFLLEDKINFPILSHFFPASQKTYWVGKVKGPSVTDFTNSRSINRGVRLATRAVFLMLLLLCRHCEITLPVLRCSGFCLLVHQI